jgi:two-component system, sensor histidine kinase
MNNLKYTSLAAVVYFLAGLAGTQFSIPPGFASAVWPASGIALTCALLLPNSAVFGITLGSVAINLWISRAYLNTDNIWSWLVPMVIGSGATLQALVGRWLIQQKLSAPYVITSMQDALQFLLYAGIVSCCVASTVGSGILILSNVIAGNAFAFTWFTWWIGDAIGVMIFTPILLLLFNPRQKISRKLRVIPLLLISFAMVSTIFFIARNNASEKIESEFNSQVDAYIEGINVQLRDAMHQVDMLNALFISSTDINRIEFETFSQRLMAYPNGLSAVAWVPRINAAEREFYEYHAQQQNLNQFSIRQKNTYGELISAQKRETYFPIYFLYPLEENKKILGFDLYTDNNRQTAIFKAAESGQATITAQLNLLQNANSISFLYLSPVYKNTFEKSFENIRGFALGILNIKKIIDGSAKNTYAKTISLNVQDITNLENKKTLFSSVSSTALLSHKKIIKVADHQWEIIFSLNDDFFYANKDWTSWYILTGGLLFTVMLTAFLLSLTGVTELIEQEVSVKTEALKKAKQKADAGSHAKSVFLANMSHELRTPLNGVIGMLTLADKTDSPELMRTYISKAKRTSNLLLGIINDILDVSKIEADKLHIEEIPFLLQDVIHNINDMFTSIAENKNLIYKQQGQIAGLPTLLGDPLRLQQVLINLLNNAIKFTSQGHVTLICSYTSTDNHLILSFTIEDSGIGIAAQDLQKLFQPFSQADTSTTRKYGGSGLGLVICKHLVQEMGGTLTVESHLGTGSKFTFDILVKKARTTIPTSSTSDNLHKHGRIMVVEDNEINAEVMLGLLQEMGHQVVHCSDGLEAVNYLAENSDIDLVFMDMQMPIMDGMRATQLIRQQTRNQHLPILGLSANALDADKQNALAAGMDEYHTKPIAYDALQNIIARWLHHPSDY